MTHKPHDTRRTYVLLQTRVEATECIIQKIMGHAGKYS